MARHKDFNWNMPEGVKRADGSSIHQWESIHTSLLMDIRDELKRLNGLLHCGNFLDMPRKLDAIVKNTTKKKPKLKVVKKKAAA